MTDADYITTTGETWKLSGEPHPYQAHDAESNFLILPWQVLAELRALRAQRDELLAALTKIAEGAELRALRAQRDELLAALEALVHVAVWDDDFTTEAEFRPAMDQARAAIARATGAQEAQR